MNTSLRPIVIFAVSALTIFIAAPFAIAQSGNAGLPTRSNDAGGVRVVLTPKSLAAKSDWEFAVTMDTHSKPLDADLTKAAVLVDDGGRRYVPLSWQGDPPGGHHRKGVLRFPAPSEQVKSFELQIQGLGGENKRVFQWTMK